MRALKFNTSGVYQNMTIGKAGFREYYEDDGISLEWITDVAEDDDDSVYLVDGGANHVAKFDSSGSYLFSFGEVWGDDFDNPWGIAFDSASRVFISDRYNNRIRIYDNTGTHLTDFGSQGTGPLNFNQPTHIALTGNLLYVADRSNHRVQILNVADVYNISYVATLGTGSAGSANGQFNRPQGVAVNTSYIFVADSNNNRVQVFNNTPPYGYVTKFGSYGSAHGQLDWPTDVAVDSVGNVYVADTNNHRIEKFTSAYSYNLTYGTTDVPYVTDAFHYNNPSGVALTPDGSVFISEGRGRRIMKLNGDGTQVWTVGTPGVSLEDNSHFGWPSAIAVGPDGRVFVVDQDFDRVQVYSGAGGYLTTIGGYGSGVGQFDQPMGVAVDKNGKVYVTDRYNCRFQVFDSSLSYLAQKGACGSGPSQFNRPIDIAVDSASRIYVVDQNNHRVQLFDSTSTTCARSGRASLAVPTARCAIPLRSPWTAWTGSTSPMPGAITSKSTTKTASSWTASRTVGAASRACSARAHGLAADATGHLYYGRRAQQYGQEIYPNRIPGLAPGQRDRLRK